MVPEEVDALDLDREVRAELQALPRGVASEVARRLLATAHVLDEDPAEALAHAQVARRFAPRIAAVREAVGLAAYTAGDWPLAIAELRTYHRVSGRQAHIALIADAERALGRPERAIDAFRRAQRDRFATAEWIELLIVAAGARRDLGSGAAAVAMLQVPELTSDVQEPWVNRLRYAYADALLAEGRPEQAREWFARVAEADDAGETDAAERLLDLEGVVIDEDDSAYEDDDTAEDVSPEDAGPQDASSEDEDDQDEDDTAEDDGGENDSPDLSASHRHSDDHDDDGGLVVSATDASGTEASATELADPADTLTQDAAVDVDGGDHQDNRRWSEPRSGTELADPGLADPESADPGLADPGLAGPEPVEAEPMGTELLDPEDLYPDDGSTPGDAGESGTEVGQWSEPARPETTRE